MVAFDLTKNFHQTNNEQYFVHTFTEQHGVPLKYIEAVDKTKIPKAHKRQGSKR